MKLDHKLLCQPRVIAAALAAAILLPSCGGGGSLEELFGPPTVRPKTLFDIQMGLDSYARFEFYPDSDEPTALTNGDIETGAFAYLDLNNEIDGSFYDNNETTQSNVVYPLDVSTGTYTYRALNANQGILTLIGVATTQIPPFDYDSADGEPLSNGSLMWLFESNSSGALDEKVEIQITFETVDELDVTVTSARVRQPDSPFGLTLDDVIIPVSGFRLMSTGEPVPVNYLGDPDPDGYGNIVPETLDRMIITANNADPTLTFTSDFTRTGFLITGLDGLNPEEEGTCILNVWDPIAGAYTPINGIDYTWRRILGTNTGEVVFSGIPDDPDLPYDVQINGSWIFDFEALDSGTYAGDTSGDFTAILR